MFARERVICSVGRIASLRWLGLSAAAVAIAATAWARPNGGWGSVWSPTGHDIVFLSAGPTETPNIWLREADGTSRQLTTRGVRRIEGWSPDGKALFYFSVRNGSMERYRVDVATGVSLPAPVELPEGVTRGYPSPDGKWLAVVRDEKDITGLWLRDTETGQQRAVAESFRITAVAWRPDSSALAFGSTEARGMKGVQVWVYDIAEEELAHLAAKGAHNPQWAPDGSILSFDAPASPNTVMPFTVDFTGSAAEVVPHHKATHRGVGSSWSPNGRFRAVIGFSKLGRDELWFLDRGGSVAKRFSYPGLRMRRPSWRCDSRVLAVEGMTPKAAGTEIWTLNTRTGWFSRLVPSWSSVTHCRWSDDGRQVGYLRHHGRKLRLELLDLEKRRPRRICLTEIGRVSNWRWAPGGETAGVLIGGKVFLLSGGTLAEKPLAVPGRVVDFCWGPAPDVLFASLSTGGAPFVVRIAVNEPSNPRLVLGPQTKERPQGSNGTQAAASPDGRLVAFVRDGELLVADIEREESRILVDKTDGAKGGTATVREPVWSPDGTRIAYQVRRQIGREYFIDLCVIPATGGEARVLDTERVTTEYAVFSHALTWPPAWSPDGRRITFSSDRWGQPTVALAAADGSGVAPLEHAVGGYPAWSPDGKVIAYCPAGEASRTLRAVSVDVSPVQAGPVRAVWRRVEGGSAQ